MYFNKGIEETLKELNTNETTGLTSDEVKNRQQKYGLNTLATEKKDTMLKLILSQLNDAMIYILIGAAILSAIVGEISDSIIIAIVIILNAVIGVIQESKAEKSLEALKSLSTPKAIVKRDGDLKEIPSEEIVPGDIIIIDAGRYIPCDIRLIETANLQIEESALTGESVPVNKDANITLENEDTPLGDKKTWRLCLH